MIIKFKIVTYFLQMSSVVVQWIVTGHENSNHWLVWVGIPLAYTHSWHPIRGCCAAITGQCVKRVNIRLFNLFISLFKGGFNNDIGYIKTRRNASPV